MKKILSDLFGLNVITIVKLNGYDNANYKLTTGNASFIFKTYPNDPALFDLIRAEIDALLFLQKYNSENYPKPLPFKDGEYIKLVNLENELKICRLLSFQSGEFMGDVMHSTAMFSSFGKFIAQMNLDLASFKNYIIKSRQWQWDMQYFHLNKPLIKDITSPKDQNLVRYFFQQYEENVRPVFHQLRKSTIHNDANEWNTLTKKGLVSSIIDFGDISYAPLIIELAIAIAYACYDKSDPLRWAEIIVKSYHEVISLEEIEISLLYYMIAARLCTSACNAAHSKINKPENTYASSSEHKAIAMLYKWITFNPIHVENCFRKAAGYKIRNPEPINELIKKRNESISPILSLSYKQPIHMTRSAFQYMYDAQGHTYLDAYNNIPHVGHAHPRVTKAGQDQMSMLNTNTRYIYKQLASYAEKLLSKFPSILNKIFFVNSGSAASDLAIRMARNYNGFSDIMVMEHGYHGHTHLGIDISDYKFNNQGGNGIKDFIIKNRIPDVYRSPYNINQKSPGNQYAIEVIHKLNESKNKISAIIAEPIIGCGGQVPLAEGYLKTLYPEIRKQGGVCISDEVQTGFGRLGAYFWGFQMHDVIPDIVILGKPMGNGHPMGAVVTTEAIADSFNNGMEFFSSFGGNPISCTIGSAVLDVIEEEGLQHNAKVVGDHYKKLLMELQSEYNYIGDVRGEGLFLGIEIVKNKISKEPHPELAKYIKNKMRHHSILIGTDGPYDSVLKTKPPLCFTKENAQHVVDTINDILKTYE